MIDLESLPRMLQELCEGTCGRRTEIYALDLANGVRLWLCRSCWGTARRKYEVRHGS